MSAPRIQCIPLEALDASTINPLTFTLVTANALPESCFLLRIINDSNTDVFINYNNGLTVHDFVKAGTTVEISGQGNARNFTVANFPVGLKVYAAGTAGVGSICVTGYYINKQV